MNPPNDRIWVGSWSQCHHHGNCQVTWDLPADYGRDIIRQSQHREVGDGGPAVSSAVLTFRMSDQRGSQRWQNCLHVFTVTLQLQTSYCAERQPVPSLFSVLLLSGHITVIWCSIYDAAFHSCVISQSTKVWNVDLIISYNYNMISSLPFQAAVVKSLLYNHNIISQIWKQHNRMTAAALLFILLYWNSKCRKSHRKLKLKVIFTLLPHRPRPSMTCLHWHIHTFGNSDVCWTESFKYGNKNTLTIINDFMCSYITYPAL